MILYIQIILIIVLIAILTALYLDEKQNRKIRIPKGWLTEVWDGTERRRFTRISCNVSVRYTFPRGLNNINAVKTKDISVGGICMTVSEKLPLHTTLRLEIECESASAPIFANGEVVWVRENIEQKNEEGIRYFNIGIEFKEILTKDRRQLFEFISGAK